VQHHHDEPRGVFHPYQAGFWAGFWPIIYAAHDDDGYGKSGNNSQPTHTLFCGASAAVAQVRGENEVMAPRIRNQASGLACSKSSRTGLQQVQQKISYYKVRVSTGGVETRWLGWQFLNGL